MPINADERDAEGPSGGAALERPRLRLQRHQERRLLAGHPWIFSNELDPARSDPARAGEVVDLVSHEGRFVGTAYYNPHTLIACRILARQRQTPDAAFFRRRLRAALRLRERLYPGARDLRLVFSEADNLPGLIVDRYADWLSIQLLTAGMDALREPLLEALEEELHPEGIVLRGDTESRRREGLPEEKGLLRGSFPGKGAGAGESEERGPLVRIEQNGLPFFADLLHGQKTGFYYDQRENRELLARFLRPGQSLADLCCYTGSWALKAAALGASPVVGVDTSAAALALAAENAALGGLAGRVTWRQGDAEQVCLEWVGEGRRFDLVVLDPPSLAPSRRSLAEAGERYRRLNAAAMRLVVRGGLLLTCSCSHLMGREPLGRILASAAAKAGRYAQLLAWGGQAGDHPVLLAAPETEYLHCAVLQVN